MEKNFGLGFKDQIKNIYLMQKSSDILSSIVKRKI